MQEIYLQLHVPSDVVGVKIAKMEKSLNLS